MHAREQVPLLMEMRKADLALDKAIESGDPQLGMSDGIALLFIYYYCINRFNVVRYHFITS